MGTPHPRGPSALFPLLNQIRRDVWDYSHRRNLNPPTSCPLMRSLVSVGVSVKCLLNNSRLTARHGGRGRRDEEGGMGHGSEGRGVDDRLMWGWRRKRGEKTIQCLSLVSLRQLVEHSMCSRDGEDSAPSLKKKEEITQRGWGCESYTARKISQNG